METVSTPTESQTEKVNKIKELKDDDISTREKLSSRVPLDNVRNRTSIQTKSLGNGITRTRTTFVSKVDSGKIVNRVLTKTVQEKPAEYEYIYDDDSETQVTTTPRIISRNRGSVKFESNDLSSLLALDFSSRRDRTKQSQTTVKKSRKRVLIKPKETIEHEEVEEFVYKSTNEGNGANIETKRPTASKPTSTTSQAPIRRRSRPTRPTTTEKSIKLDIEATTLQHQQVIATTII